MGFYISHNIFFPMRWVTKTLFLFWNPLSHFSIYCVRKVCPTPSLPGLLVPPPSHSPARLCGSVGSAAGRRAGCSAAAFPGSRQVSGCRPAATDACSGPVDGQTRRKHNETRNCRVATRRRSKGRKPAVKPESTA